MPTPPPYYSFLPWGRRGIASQLTETEQYASPFTAGTLLERADVTIQVNVTADSDAPVALPVNLQIIGPGDIIGISPNVVVKTEPHNWITNFEPHSMAFIDFYEEDFPWRYSPAKASTDQKLRPWLTLVVLKDNEFTRNAATPGAPLNSFSFTNAANTWPLPKHSETWAWAHIQVNGRIDPNGQGLATAINNVNKIITDTPDNAISRIICPRQLEENTAYTAFLIPTYETGRRAGLGKTTTAAVTAQMPAWGLGSTAEEPEKFPIYYEWYFRTGTTGDFEYLVRQLQPRALDSRVGRRKMDVQNIGYNLSYTEGSGNNKGTLMLEGALRAPTGVPPVYPYPDTNDAFRIQLRDFLNLGQDIADPVPLATFSGSGNVWSLTTSKVANKTVVDDPFVTPPMYGRWHALRNRVYKDPPVNSTIYPWIDELNLDPRQRVAAALGGDYVRQNQENLMNQAWKQVGEIIKANNLVNWGQLAVETTQSMHERHIASQEPEQVVAITSRAHSRIKSGNVSLRQATLSTVLPDSTQSTAFRKIQRPKGALMKRVDSNAEFFSNSLQRLAQGTISPEPGQPVPMVASLNVADLNVGVNDSLSANTGAMFFSVMSPGVMPMSSNPPEADAFQQMLSDYSAVFTAVNWAGPTPAPTLNTSSVATLVLNTTEPLNSLPTRFYKSKKFMRSDNGLPPVDHAPADPGHIVPAMAAPSFNMPMYDSLKSLGIDFFIPNLNLLPQNSVTILETNQKFIESFMVGANYEMARELLWREYPTDQRGTYFRHFWNTTDAANNSGLNAHDLEIASRDIDNIHAWGVNTALGSHNARAPLSTNNLVLAIRGDFLKKFPNAVIYATPAIWQDSTPHNQPRLPDLDPLNFKYPIFSARVNPDITFLGFDIDRNTAVGISGAPGWFFVITERPGELRFGLDTNTGTLPPTMVNWNDLTWDNVTKVNGYIDLASTPAPALPGNLLLPPTGGTSVGWAQDASAMAMILYQHPVMIAIHAHEMIL